MDAQLSIKTLLTAARLLEGGYEANTIIQSLPPVQDMRPTTLSPPLTSRPCYAALSRSQAGNFQTPFNRNSGALYQRRCELNGSYILRQRVPNLTVSLHRHGKTQRSIVGVSLDDSFTQHHFNICIPCFPSPKAAHNELEKTRRANLRGCLETLKTLVPPLGDASRNTTLALLTRARDHIKQLEEGNAALQQERNRLEDRKSMLQNELERLRESTSQSTSRPSSTSSRLSRDSPVFLEYSPTSKPAQSPQPIIIDPVAEGLLPALPICYPRPSLYPYLDLTPSRACASFDMPPFLPIHLRV
ncbi:Helix-loop-helix DNA-binding domain protein [Necator americanus]|uniref:Helix-loop-helix DNA-binding domain protein n=1 Tax=Necator americanus TaxID=51031 RepID=W2SRA3_NECAM|nr:Helix-loop-helix DNA-binding domain protein [Necator americanus]ETN72048.1 Helix-loop-helix DNA-binding domain protein [Necator americanus]